MRMKYNSRFDAIIVLFKLIVMLGRSDWRLLGGTTVLLFAIFGTLLPLCLQCYYVHMSVTVLYGRAFVYDTESYSNKKTKR